MELLIAVAVFGTLMAGVSLLMTSAVRTVRQAEQTREAFDLARGAMRVLQDDLVSAYSARERGDVFQFYGTPIGMTFVALVETEERIPQLARITYALHVSEELPAREVKVARIDENGDEVLETQWLVSLVRFVEPGVADLESFPVPWSTVSVAGPDERVYTVDELVDRRMADLVASPGSNHVAGDERLRERIERVTKRQLWIQMLANQAGSFWRDNNLNPRDYVLLDNVLSTTPVPRLAFDGAGGIPQPVEVPYQLDPNSDGFLYTAYYPDVLFQYGITDRYEAQVGGEEARAYMARWTIYWQDYINMLQEQDTQTGKPVAVAPGLTTRVDVGSPMFPRLPELVRTRFALFFDSPYVGVPPFLRVFEQEVNLRSGYTRQNIKEL